MSLAELYLSIDEMSWFRSFKGDCNKKGWHCEVAEPKEDKYPDRVRVFASHIIQGKELLWEHFVSLHAGRDLDKAMGKGGLIRYLEHSHDHSFSHSEFWPPKPTDEGEEK